MEILTMEKQMKNKLTSILFAVALLFCAFVFASPPDIAAKTKVKAEKSAKTDSTVAVVIENDAQYAQASRTVQTNYKDNAPPVALPSEIKQEIVRRFNGCFILTGQNKIPIEPPNINSIGRRAPDFIPLRN